MLERRSFRRAARMSSSSISSYTRAELDARFRRPLMSYFLRRVGDYGEAEDLTQQVFLRLLGSARADAYDLQAPLVFRIASNLLRDRRRAAGPRGDHLRLVDDSDIDTLSADAEDLTPERVLLSRENLSEVLRSLDQLGARTRDMFILFRLENMNQADIAALFGCSRSTVEKHVMKATYHLLLKHRTR
jgi:RNA polymerase sigma factor (sigma-70 family)